MADRRLDEVSAATDFSYAYTEDSSNNQVKISKADMASVLAANIGIKKGSIQLNSVGEYTIPIIRGLIHLRWSATSTSFIAAIASKNIIELANGYSDVYGVGTNDKVINVSKSSDSNYIKVTYTSTTTTSTLEWIALTE